MNAAAGIRTRVSTDLQFPPALSRSERAVAGSCPTTRLQPRGLKELNAYNI